MRTEASRAVGYGFKLTEAELRRISDWLQAQIKRGAGCEDVRMSLQVKFRNGSISETHALEEVLSLENFGSGSIQRLRMSVSPSGMKETYRITLELTDVQAEGESGRASITYVVLGDDRHWVFTASSELEERINKIRAFNADRVWLGHASKLYLMFLGVVMVCVTMVGYLTRSSVEPRQARIDAVEAAWRNGQLKDVVEIMLALERVSFQKPSFWEFLRTLLNVPFLAGLALVLCVLYLPEFLSHFFPPYTFYWGEHQAVYDRRRNVGRFVGVAIILSTIVGVLANYLSNLIGIGE